MLRRQPANLAALALADSRQVHRRPDGGNDPGDDDRIAQEDDQPREAARDQPDRCPAASGGSRLAVLTAAQVAPVLIWGIGPVTHRPGGPAAAVAPGRARP